MQIWSYRNTNYDDLWQTGRMAYKVQSSLYLMTCMAICECTLFVFWHVKDDICCCVCHCAARYHKTFPPLTSPLHRVCVKYFALSLVILQYQLVTFYSFSGTIKFHITSPTKLFDGFPTSPSLVGHLSHLCSWGHKTGNGLLQVLKCFHLVYFWRFILISLRLVILRSSGPGRDHKVFSEMTSIWLWKILIPRIMKLK